MRAFALALSVFLLLAAGFILFGLAAPHIAGLIGIAGFAGVLGSLALEA